MEQADLYSVTIPPMIQALENLSRILEKLAKHADGKQLEWHPKGAQEQALLHSRLISDQFDFLRQVQVACDNGVAGSARLANAKIPSFPDKEKSVPDLKKRIDRSVAFMKKIKPKDVAGQEGRHIELRYWPGKKMTAFGYATGYLLPNFYFHVITAYSILRKNGVDIGKMDYIGTLPFVK